jgi:SAM-dependent methyltransferase
MTGAAADPWASGNAYEAYVGRWSARVAPLFLSWLDVGPDGRWADIGCGTGILTRAILASSDPASVVGIDPSDGFLAHARAATTDARATFRSGTAAETGLADRSVDAAALGLVLNFVPDAGAALAEARRIAVGGAAIGAYVWDYAAGMGFIRAFWDAAVALDPAAAAQDQGTAFPIAAPGPLEAAFTNAGLTEIEVRDIEIPTTFEDFDDLWLPFTGGTGTAPAYLASLEPARREAIRERLRADVPIERDGSIHLEARAWAVRGRTPA